MLSSHDPLYRTDANLLWLIE